MIGFIDQVLLGSDDVKEHALPSKAGPSRKILRRTALSQTKITQISGR